MDTWEVIGYVGLAVCVILGVAAGISNAKARSEGTDWYSLITNNPTMYRGTAVEGQGRVLQQIANDEFLMNQHYGDLFHIKLVGSALYVTVRQDDDVRYAGQLDGVYTYTTIQDKEKTVPCIAVSYITVLPKK